MYILLNLIFCCLLFNFVAKIEAIIRGSSASDGDLPFQVSLQINNTHNCGGAILNQELVITAYHCVHGKNKEEMRIVAGGVNLKTMKHASVHRVIKFIEHPHRLPAADDLALVHVDPRFDFDDYRSQVVLPAPGFVLPKDQKLTVSGWGMTDVSVRQASTKLKVAEVFNIGECKPPYVGDFCTTHQSLINRDRGVCKGDSGGPVILNKKILVGVIAGSGYIDPLKPNNIICGSKNHPDRHVKLTHYLNWIHTKVAENSNYPVLVNE